MKTPTKKQFKDLDLKEQERLREIVGQKLATAMEDIDTITGYFSEMNWSIYADELRKTVSIELKIALLAKPHDHDEFKIKHYLKTNPDNCLNEPIFAFKWNHWYEIWNGVHRIEANRQLGKKTIKADIIIPDKEGLENRKLI